MSLIQLLLREATKRAAGEARVGVSDARGWGERLKDPDVTLVREAMEAGASDALVFDAFLKLPGSEVIGLLEAEVSSLGVTELQKLKSALSGYLSRAWLPNPGPQSDAYYSAAEIIGYGGAAGGGKTDLMLGLAGHEHQRSLLMRRESTTLTSITDRAVQIYAARGGDYRASPVKRMDFPDERVIFFGHCKEPDDWQDWQGQPRDLLALDEATQFLQLQALMLMGWVRSVKPGQRLRVLFATNPPMSADGYWFTQMFRPWLDAKAGTQSAGPGEVRWAVRLNDEMEWLEPEFGGDGRPLEVERHGEFYRPQSYTFIPSHLKDNPFLNNTNYRTFVQGLPEPRRSQLLKGDFSISQADHRWQVFPTRWVDEAMARWDRRGGEGLPMTALGVDVAAGGPDSSVLAPVHGARWFGELVVRKGEETRTGEQLIALIVMTMRGRCRIIVDLGGGYGNSAYEQLRRLGFEVRGFVANGSAMGLSPEGLRYKNVRAQAHWGLRMALDPEAGEGLALPPDDELRQELCAVRYSLDTLYQIEPKDDVRDRIGRSPDRSDAVVMAHFLGPKAHEVDVTSMLPQAAMGSQQFAVTAYEGAKAMGPGGGRYDWGRTAGGLQRFANRGRTWRR